MVKKRGKAKKLHGEIPEWLKNIGQRNGTKKIGRAIKKLRPQGHLGPIKFLKKMGQNFWLKNGKNKRKSKIKKLCGEIPELAARMIPPSPSSLDVGEQDNKDKLRKEI